jgi:uncharacterized coiled-coil protein SlyX
MDITKDEEEFTKRDLEIEERFKAMNKVIAEQRLIWESEFETFRNYCEEKLKEQRDKWNSLSVKIDMTRSDINILKDGAGKQINVIWNRVEAIEKKLPKPDYVKPGTINDYKQLKDMLTQTNERVEMLANTTDAGVLREELDQLKLAIEREAEQRENITLIHMGDREEILQDIKMIKKDLISKREGIGDNMSGIEERLRSLERRVVESDIYVATGFEKMQDQASEQRKSLGKFSERLRHTQEKLEHAESMLSSSREDGSNEPELMFMDPEISRPKKGRGSYNADNVERRSKRSIEREEMHSDDEYFYQDLDREDDIANRRTNYEHRRSVLPNSGDPDGDPSDSSSDSGRPARNPKRSMRAHGYSKMSPDNQTVMAIEVLKRDDYPTLILSTHKSIRALVSFYTEWNTIRRTHPHHRLRITEFFTKEVRSAVRLTAIELGILKQAAKLGEELMLSEAEIKKCFYELVKATSGADFRRRLQHVKLETGERKFREVNVMNYKAFYEALPEYNERFETTLKYLAVRASPTDIPRLFYRDKEPGIVDYWLAGIGEAGKLFYTTMKRKYEKQLSIMEHIREVMNFFMKYLRKGLDQCEYVKEMNMMFRGQDGRLSNAGAHEKGDDDALKHKVTPMKKKKSSFRPFKRQNLNAVTSKEDGDDYESCVDAAEDELSVTEGYYSEVDGNEEKIETHQEEYKSEFDDMEGEIDGDIFQKIGETLRDEEMNALPGKVPVRDPKKDSRKLGCYKMYHHGRCEDHDAGKCEYDHTPEGMLDVARRKAEDFARAAKSPGKDYMVKMLEKAYADKDNVKKASPVVRKGT